MRTGTMSLNQALNDIGIKSFHAPMDREFYYVIKNNYIDIDNSNFFKKYEALTDTPGPLIYKIIDKCYNNAKFILTTRVLDQWLISCENCCNKYSYKYLNGLNEKILNHGIFPFMMKIFNVVNYDKDSFIKVYYQYKNMVIDYFKNRDNLLILDVDDKNKKTKLEKFLNMKFNQDYKYPHLNKIEYMYGI